MNKINSAVLFVAMLIVGVSCDKTNNSIGEVVDDYDHESQIAKDNDSITKYLTNHYYNTNDGAIWTIGNTEAGSLPAIDQLPLIDHPSLEEMSGIKANDTETDYTMYYLSLKEGVDTQLGSPTVMDNVYVTYSGMTLDSLVFDGSNKEFPVWFSLANTIEGWGVGFQKILGGEKAIPGELEYVSEEDFRFKNKGEGYLFIPSGLAYKNDGKGIGGNLANESLIFKFELHTSSLGDHDGDSVPSRDEVSFDAFGNIEFIDTDGDGVYDYLDKDDDNDGTLTIDE